MLLPLAVVAQQAKLGVSAEESKTERLKRQQARFRDRGGAFVPSDSNPLVDILLARTVSGESPSKACAKDLPARRVSPSKARQPARRANEVVAAKGSRNVAGSSKSKPLASGKGNPKAVEPQATTKPPPKRRATARGKEKTRDIDSDPEQPLIATTKSKSTSKGKGKQRAPLSTSDGNPKSHPKGKRKPNTTKEVIEILASDNETLVEIPRKAKARNNNVRCENDGETYGDAPVIRKQAITRADHSKVSAKSVKRVKAERAAGAKSSDKKAFQDEEETIDELCPKVTAKKRPLAYDEAEEVVAAPPARKRKAMGTNLESAKTKAPIEAKLNPEPEPRPTKDAKEKSKATAKRKGKVRAQPTQTIVEPVEGVDDEQPVEHVPKLKKRKKEEDNYDDRPRKVVKFSETPVFRSSSNKLKENQSDRTSAPKSSVKDESDELRPKLATKSLSRAKTPQGPPREVLERIKASAARHLRRIDSEPDELDCLS